MPYKDPERERQRQRARAKTPAEKQRKQRYKQDHREEINYRDRVSYWTDPEAARAKNRERNARHRKNAGAPAREQRNQWRLLRQIEREKKRQDWLELAALRKTSLHRLDTPTLRIRHKGQTTVERWPPNDEAQRWIEAEQARRQTTEVVEAQPDVTPQPEGVTNPE